MRNFATQNEKNMDEIKQWFVIGSLSPKKELKVRDDARRHGLEAFVPLRYEVKTVRGQKQRKLVPAIMGLMFIKGTIEEVKDYAIHAPFQVYLRKSTFSNKTDYLVIPTKAMEDFIATTEQHEEHVTYFKPDEISLRAGDQIRIKGGIYDGKEGIVMRIKGKRNKQLVVQIPGVLVAAVELTPDLIEIDSPAREKPSKDVDKDKKLLLETAHRLLFEIPDKYQQENEYYLLLSELKRVRDRLVTFRGYTPASEAELALPLYLAAVKLQEGVFEAEERLQKAVNRLKDTSKLKAKCLEYIELCKKL
jgi:ribosomal protein L24